MHSCCDRGTGSGFKWANVRHAPPAGAMDRIVGWVEAEVGRVRLAAPVEEQPQTEAETSAPDVHAFVGTLPTSI